MGNKITALADKIRNGSITTEDLRAFIEEQLPLIRNSKLGSLGEGETAAIEESKAYVVAHSLFERMVEERMLAEAILEDPEAWDYEESQKDQAVQGLKQHAEDFYKLAEKLLMVAWHGYEKG